MAVVGTLAGASCMVAAETSFGMVDSADARALDTSGIGALTAYSLRITRASFNAAAGAPKMVVYDRAEISTSGGIPAPVIAAAVDGSGPVDSISGDVTIAMELRGFGANDPSATGLGLILESAFGSAIRSAGTAQSATYIGANTYSVTGGDEAEVIEGDLAPVVQDDGTLRFCHVSDVSGTGPQTVKVVEAHGQNVGTFTTRSCHMWYESLSGSGDGASICMQLKLVDDVHGRLLTGGRLMKLSIKPTGETSCELELTIRFTDGKKITSAVIPVTTPLPYGVSGTTPLVRRVAPVLVTQDHSGSSAPYGGTVSNLAVREWSVDVDIALQQNGSGQATRSGVGGLSVASAKLTGSFTVDSPTSIDWQDVLRLGQARSIGFSLAGANAAGNGACVWVGRVDPVEDPGITFEDSDRKQVVSFRAGEYVGDNSGTGEYENRSWLLGFVS